MVSLGNGEGMYPLSEAEAAIRLLQARENEGRSSERLQGLSPKERFEKSEAQYRSGACLRPEEIQERSEQTSTSPKLEGQPGSKGRTSTGLICGSFGRTEEAEKMFFVQEEDVVAKASCPPSRLYQTSGSQMALCLLS